MSNEKDNMSLVEYAEKIAPFPLSNFQKELLEKYEECEKRVSNFQSNRERRLFFGFGKHKAVSTGN